MDILFFDDLGGLFLHFSRLSSAKTLEKFQIRQTIGTFILGGRGVSNWVNYWQFHFGEGGVLNWVNYWQFHFVEGRGGISAGRSVNFDSFSEIGYRSP